MIAGIPSKMSVFLLERSVPYEGSQIIHVFTDRATADEAWALYATNQEGGSYYDYEVSEMVVDSGVPSAVRWFTTKIQIQASRPNSWFEYTKEHVEIAFDHEDIETTVFVDRVIYQVTNPNYVRDTPNARHVNVPEGRWLSDPTISVLSRSLSREESVRVAYAAAHAEVPHLPAVGELWPK